MLNNTGRQKERRKKKQIDELNHKKKKHNTSKSTVYTCSQPDVDCNGSIMRRRRKQKRNK